MKFNKFLIIMTFVLGSGCFRTTLVLCFFFSSYMMYPNWTSECITNVSIATGLVFLMKLPLFDTPTFRFSPVLWYVHYSPITYLAHKIYWPFISRRVIIYIIYRYGKLYPSCDKSQFNILRDRVAGPNMTDTEVLPSTVWGN